MEKSQLARAIKENRHRDGLASIMGQNPIGIERTRKLIPELAQLDPEDLANLGAWCAIPTPELTIIPERRDVLEDLAAHEFGHLVAARAFGFNTGEIGIELTSMDGSHIGTVEIEPHIVTSDLAAVMDYLQRRVMVHFAGMLSQWPQLLMARQVFHAIQEEGGESDRQKAFELIRVILNIKGDMTDDGPVREMLRLATKANQLVTHNFTVIRFLASRFAANIQFYGQTHRWTTTEIDIQPEIVFLTAPSATLN